jgi:hypothetical protein
MSKFEEELESLLNRHSKENESNTPDFILRQFMVECLQAFTNACNCRSKWYGNDAAEVVHPNLSDGTINFTIEMCPRCNQVVNSRGENYCSLCGQRIKGNNLTIVEGDNTVAP